MKKIETEYGTFYSGTHEELEQVEAESAKGLESGKCVDETKFRTSWAAVTVVALVFFVIGFIIGLVLMGDPEFRLSGFITIIILTYVIGRARREIIKYEAAHIEMIHESRQEELKLLNKRRDVAVLENKKLNAATKVARELSKTDNLFSSNDFDDTAQAMLLKVVEAARKKKLRVTGQGLIETILKGIH